MWAPLLMLFLFGADSSLEFPCPDLVACAKKCAAGNANICMFLMRVQQSDLEYDTACRSGQAKECMTLAHLLEHEPFFRGHTSMKRVAFYLDRGCALGDGVGCNNLGALLAAGMGVPRDDAQALTSWARGCDLANAQSCMNLGNRYRQGRGVARDPAVALRLLERGCTLGSGDACHYAGLEVDGGGQPKFKKRARALFERGCILDAPYACYSARDLGSKVTNPAAEQRNVEEMRALCEQGYPVGCSNLGLAYKLGRGVPADRLMASNYFGKACDRDHPDGCYDLASLHVEEGSADGRARAIRMYEKGCRLQDHRSCATGGALALAAPVDAAATSLGVELLDHGCRGGRGEACLELAALYRRGTYVQRDLEAASRFTAQACAAGNREACRAKRR